MAGAHALVLEPDDTIRAQIDRVLRDSGWSVESTASTSDAVAAASSRHPDVVALDVRAVQAPRLVAAELRVRCGRRLPILAMGSVRDDHLADDVAAFDSILLPAQIDELPERLKKANGRGQTRRRPEHTAEEGTQRRPAATPRTIWRYKTLRSVDGIVCEDGNRVDASGRRSLREHADLLGEDGWELVGLTANKWVFKRGITATPEARP